MKKNILITVCVGLVALSGYGAYTYMWPPDREDGGHLRDIPKGFREYIDEEYPFSLIYPETLSTKTYEEEGGARTVIFQDVAAVKGFQIFIVPFTEPQVTEERFRKDVPSGVRTDVTDITVDGASGAAFYSTNTILGETYEMWFIYDDHLYEVTAPKPLGDWLRGILDTWIFIGSE